jgi:hypothetical protein
MTEGRIKNHSDYHEVGVRRVRHRHTESSEISGRTIRRGEHVAVGVTLAPDTFTLPAAAESRRGK